jgi:hypothetical protein
VAPQQLARSKVEPATVMDADPFVLMVSGRETLGQEGQGHGADERASPFQGGHRVVGAWPGHGGRHRCALMDFTRQKAANGLMVEVDVQYLGSPAAHGLEQPAAVAGHRLIAIAKSSRGGQGQGSGAPEASRARRRHRSPAHGEARGSVGSTGNAAPISVNHPRRRPERNQVPLEKCDAGEML